MNQDRVIIVGAGQGGVQAAMSLRQEGHSGPITLMGSEPVLPYQRPPLSKSYLKDGAEEKLTLRPAAFFERNHIELRTGVRVEAIDRGSRSVRAGNEWFGYEHLILATGASNLVPPIPGIERAVGLRTLEDASVLRAALQRPARIAVIGGGLIGLEFAAVARRLGHEVSVSEAAPRLMQRLVSPELSERFLHKHRELGTRISLGSGVVDVNADGVVLADGTGIAADMVLVAAGVRPNAELAVEAGLETDNGIVVNATLRTADPAIYALGDCCAFPGPRGGALLRTQSVQAASDHARCIARSIATGRPHEYSAVPWFWSDQDDWKLQIAGLASPDDISIEKGDDTVLRFSTTGLTAVETINNARIHMTARKLLAGNAPWLLETLAAVDFDLTQLSSESVS